MIDTKTTDINSIYSSINDIRQTIVKNAQDNLADYTEDSLLSHNRAAGLTVCMLNGRFHIDTSKVSKNRAFICSLANPNLKMSDNEKKLHTSSLQFLKDYFDEFKDADIIAFAINYPSFINKKELDKWIIINYSNIKESNQYDDYISNYIAQYHLTEYIIYWFEHFAKLEELAQDDLQNLNLVLKPITYTNHTGQDPIIIATFIDRIANLIFTKYPDYDCNNLVKAICIHFENIKYKQLNLPFKYLDNFLSIVNHEDTSYNYHTNNMNIPVNFKILTMADMNKLMDIAIDLTEFSFKLEEFQSLVKSGVTIDIGHYQSEIESIINNFENIYQLTHNDSSNEMIKTLKSLCYQ